MLKKDARKLYREKRNALSAGQRSKMDDLMLIRFQAIELPAPVNVLSYWPLESNNEPNTFLFTDYLSFQFPAIQMCYPTVDEESGIIIALAVDDDSTFKANYYDIMEPIDGLMMDPLHLDIVFVPLLIFDQRGYRVGYGKGFYDKFLSNCRSDCLKVGLCYFEPIDTIDDCHEFDVPLDLCITPQKPYVF